MIVIESMTPGEPRYLFDPSQVVRPGNTLMSHGRTREIHEKVIDHRSVGGMRFIDISPSWLGGDAGVVDGGGIGGRRFIDIRPPPAPAAVTGGGEVACGCGWGG